MVETDPAFFFFAFRLSGANLEWTRKELITACEARLASEITLLTSTPVALWRNN